MGIKVKLDVIEQLYDRSQQLGHQPQWVDAVLPNQAERGLSGIGAEG
jgi:hypothetical protein